ncbi:MAG: HipA N-terminal domain-containing protein, partial [Propionibacteriaceae bacterium]|nr:HipA N-terminal domain-containing protein [Propionibacteriaceae bacterium]
MTAVEVHLDCGPRAARGAPAPPTRVGTLFTHLRRGRLTSTFAYAEDWLADPRAYPLDPELPLVTGLIAPTAALPRAVADAAPDRWGRDLIARQARADGQTRTLDESDYLLGVGDLTRHGALRFRLEPGGP